ncbi:MAG TPA: tRNA (N6-isopentenyl adenosine(37)-C2)-methylthiotransferase MiaB, partial [Treponemataceae bacterium]|nr:tRNA (N6-isopentenyl adenosine(37)-C2)-methylthiotransferase MiaB [Treponemataceae bacterium]
SSLEKGAFQSFVPIMNGCNNFCTYCIVPYVRGREVSRDLSEILTELDLLADRGVREITLLGQNVNSYRYPDPDTGTVLDFPALLERVCRKIEERGVIQWVRFTSSHPKDFSDELIEVIAREKAVCNMIHLPVQNGSNRILKAMNRKYTREEYLALVGRIRSRIPGATLSTDILVGFPGETEEDLEDTLSLMQTVSYDAAFMYHYNPREGTAAFDLPNRIPDDLKKERLARVIELQHRMSRERMRARVGTGAVVLVESVSRNNQDELFGHTELGDMVVFSGKQDLSLVGHFVSCQLTGLRGRTFRAKILENGGSACSSN